CGCFLGGISPAWSFSRTASQVGRSSWRELASALCSTKSPECLVGPWHPTQYLPMNGLATWSNDPVGADFGVGGPAALGLPANQPQAHAMIATSKRRGAGHRSERSRVMERNGQSWNAPGCGSGQSGRGGRECSSIISIDENAYFDKAVVPFPATADP